MYSLPVAEILITRLGRPVNADHIPIAVFLTILPPTSKKGIKPANGPTVGALYAKSSKRIYNNQKKQGRVIILGFSQFVVYCMWETLGLWFTGAIVGP